MQKFLSPQNKIAKIEVMNVDTDEIIPDQYESRRANKYEND
jgi:3-isopropylmalate dehydratase small subunit